MSKPYCQAKPADAEATLQEGTFKSYGYSVRGLRGAGVGGGGGEGTLISVVTAVRHHQRDRHGLTWEEISCASVSTRPAETISILHVTAAVPGFYM